MKNISLLLFLVLAQLMSLQAQTTLWIQGSVHDNGVPIPNHEVYVVLQSAGSVLATDTVLTDVQGIFAASFAMTPFFSQGTAIISTLDCNGNLLTQTSAFNPNLLTLNAIFNFCSNNPGVCMAAFSALPTASGAVAFINQSVPSSPNAAMTYVWDLGDGNTSTQENPTHLYTAPGTYSVCLTITDALGCVDSSCNTVVIPTSTGCYADFSYIYNNSTSSFDFNSGQSFGSTGQPLSFMWDFGDGTIDTTANPSHSYGQPGIYVVCLTVTDASGCTDTYCETITYNFLPTCSANFSFGANPNNPNTIDFVADSSLATAYFWDFGDGTGTSTIANPSYTYAQPGIYQVCLTITCSNGISSTWCAPVFVGQNAVCVANFMYLAAGNNSYVFIDQSIGGTGGTALSYQWDFGDGGTSTQQNPVYTYSQSGVFNVCLTITDASGCVDSTCQTVVVPGSNGCIADFTYTVGPNQTAHFLSTSSGNNLVHTWDFGDGNMGGTNCPSHMYANPGSYLVCLTVTDSVSGCTDTYCDSVNVTSIPVYCSAAFSFQPLGSGAIQFFHQNLFGNPLNMIQSYLWDFGDGDTSHQAFPIHTYAQGGTYNVCLSIVDITGCTDTFCLPVNVPNVSPCAAAFTSVSGPNLDVDFTSLGSASANLSHTWDFGDGSTGTGNTVSHTYANFGSYYVCLTVTDNQGCTDTYCDSVFAYTMPGVCQADFSYQTSGSGQVYFFDQSLGLPGLATVLYDWDFGDGNTSNVQFPVHTYSQSGTYTVCLTITDTSTNCVSTTCRTLTIGNSSGCNASFNYSITPNSPTVFFQSAATGFNLNYSWAFGDGSGQIGPVATHTYSASGTYVVCLTVSNSNCTATFCDTITVQGSNTGCQASFVSLPLPNGGYQFINTSLPDPSFVFPASATWDFGDGTTSNQMGPTHTFNGPGPFNVCLIYSAAGCVDTVCQTVGGYSVNGGVYAVNSPTGVGFINDGIAYLIYHDTIAGTLTAVDSVYLTQSFYNFDNVAPGTYLVKAALLPSSPIYASFLPTYLGNDLFWNNALSVVVTNTHVFNPDINLVAGTNTGGPGFIGGLISQGANKQEGDPMHNISVLLLDINDNPITHTTSDTDGMFAFDNLPYGTYKIYVEIPGLISTPRIVTIDADNPFIDWADFEVNSSSVTTGIEDRIIGQGMKLFPNPASARFSVQLEVLEQMEGTVSVMNLMGQTVIDREVRWLPGIQELELDATHLPEGAYLVVVRSNGQMMSKRLWKRN